jgi:phenylacetate-coenzyme A ligase PaaK-like adenylate-forming protein
MSSIEEQRARHMALAMEMAPELIGRLDWESARLQAHRTQALRALVRVAVDRSPWHRKRLAGVCPDRIELGDVRDLPVMTKADVMSHFDEIVTDDRITLAAAEDYLAEAATRGYLLGEYTPLATGGSSGQRGVFVYDRPGLATYWLSAIRNVQRVLQRDEGARDRAFTIAYVTSSHPSHVAAAVARIFTNPAVRAASIPVTRPLGEIVGALNDLQPDVLGGYASMLHVLADEAAQGRLRIAPRCVGTAGEPLLPETRAAISATWPVPLVNVWGATESGCLMNTCAHGRAHLAEDTAIIELVDADGRPVRPGARAAKILITNLFNPVLPLIRYEISDEVTLLAEACPCGAPSACVEDVQGRRDDAFSYGGTWVHPHAFRSALGRRTGIVEYQVRQTASGADIRVHCRDRVDLDELAREIEAGLGGLGLPEAVVTIAPVERLDRSAGTGKLRRFVPLAVQPVTGHVR